MRRLNVADLNAIETRVGGWVAGCQHLIDVFLKDKDPYIDSAVKITGISYEVIAADLKSKNPEKKAAAKALRQMGKVATLGCIYRLGGGQMGVTKDGDPIKTGFWGFAENYGVNLTQEQSAIIVKVYRNTHPEIVQFWEDIERAVSDVLEAPKTVRYLGPNGCIKIDKVTIKDRNPMLRIKLPSGRCLHYLDARIESCKMPWKDSDGNDVYKPTLVYAGQDQKTKQWGDYITSHGGKLFENIVQGIARDVLAYFLLLIELAGLDVCAHVHDEGVAETDDDPFTPGSEFMEKTMSQSISWAPGLPLKAEGFESPFYRKN